MISTPNARFFGMESNVGSDNFSRCFEACAAITGRMHAVFVRAARQNSENFAVFLQFLRASLAQNLRDIDVRRALLRIWTHGRLGQELQRRSLFHAAHAD